MMLGIVAADMTMVGLKLLKDVQQSTSLSNVNVPLPKVLTPAYAAGLGSCRPS